MKNVKVQIALLLKRKTFIFTLTLMIILAVAAFAVNCFHYFGDYEINVMAAKYLNANSSFLRVALVPAILQLIFPLIPIIPFADSYFEDREKGTVNFCITRCSDKAYYFSKLFAVFISGALVIGFPLLLNFFLNLIAFPLDSVNTSQNLSIPNCQIFSQSVIDSIIFKKLFCRNMYLYNLLFILIDTVFAGLSAVITYQISFFYKKSRIILICLYFAAYHFGCLIVSSFFGGEFNASNYILSSNFIMQQSVRGLIIVFALLLAAAAVPTPFAVKRLSDSL